MADRVNPMLQEHVQRWRRAASELEAIRERELQTVDTREAVRQLFGNNTLVQNAPRLNHSGLIDQQVWFARLRKSQMPE